MSPTRLLTFALALAMGWGLYWAVGAWTTHRAFVSWMEERRADGWQADWSDITLRGFPNRFDRTVHDLALADPQSGWAWEASFFQILSLSYRQDQHIFVWPPESTLMTPLQKISVTGSQLRASVEVDAQHNHRLRNTALVFKDVALMSDDGWSLSIDTARLGVRETPGRSGWIDIAFQAEGLRPPSRAMDALSDLELVPPRFDRLSLDLAVGLEDALDLGSIETERPRIHDVEVRSIRMSWGKLDLAVAGELVVQSDGKPQGQLQVKARNWKDIVAVAVETGLMSEAIANVVTHAMELVSRMAGSPETLDLRLAFRGGRTWIGPVPVAEAPRLSLP